MRGNAGTDIYTELTGPVRDLTADHTMVIPKTNRTLHNNWQYFIIQK